MLHSVRFPLVLILLFLLSAGFGYSQNDLDNEAIVNQLLQLEAEYASNREDVLGRLDFLIDSCLGEGFLFGEARTKSQKSWGILYKGKYEEALKLGHEALKIQKEIRDSVGLSYTLRKIAICNLKMNQLSLAKTYLLESLALFENRKDSFNIFGCLQNLGGVYHAAEDFNGAIKSYKKALSMPYIKGRLFEEAQTLFNIGSAYMALNKLDSAKGYLFKSNDILESLGENGLAPPLSYAGLGMYYSAESDLKNAINYYVKAEELAEEMNDFEILISVRELLASTYYESSQYKKAYDTQMLFIKNKNRMDSLNNLAAVAEIEEKYKNSESKLAVFKLQNEKAEALNSANKWFFRTLILLLALVIIFFVFYVINHRRIQAQFRERVSLKADLAESKLIGLKSQMNPHFVFNCINTAQNFILSSKKEKAYEYLTSFAKLLRLVLENSNNSFISIQEEIEQLELYINLEAIRFKNKFQYSLDLDDELKSGMYEIPGMIIQPIIENAILHGLVNKEGNEGSLTLTFKLKAETIIGIIEDNGIGRKKAVSIKESKELHYQSSAELNIKSRLELLEKALGKEVSFQIIDLFKNDEPCGTRVTVTLPFM